MILLAEVVDDEAPQVAKFTSVAGYLVWVSGSWTFFNALGVIASIMMIVLDIGEPEDAFRNGSYSAIWGTIGLVVWLGALQMSKMKNYYFSMFAALLSCVPLISPWFLIGIPIGFRSLMLLRDPTVKRAFSTGATASQQGGSLLRKQCLVFAGIVVWAAVFNIVGAAIVVAFVALGLDFQPYSKLVFSVAHAIGILCGIGVAKLWWPQPKKQQGFETEVKDE